MIGVVVVLWMKFPDSITYGPKPTLKPDEKNALKRLDSGERKNYNEAEAPKNRGGRK
jgi:hypothetical protein